MREYYNHLSLHRKYIYDKLPRLYIPNKLRSEVPKIKYLDPLWRLNPVGLTEELSVHDDIQVYLTLK